MLNKPSEIAAAALVVLAAGTAPAHAYLDPGTGSLILQGLIGGVAGGLFILRTWWSRIVALISGRRSSGDEAGADSAQP